MTRRWTIMLALLALILLFGLFPLISVYVASLLASSHGCVLNEAGPHPCVILGTDMGGLLVGMFVLGWLMLATIPAGGVALVAWLIAAIVMAVRGRSGEPPEGNPHPSTPHTGRMDRS